MRLGRPLLFLHGRLRSEILPEKRRAYCPYRLKPHMPAGHPLFEEPPLQSRAASPSQTALGPHAAQSRFFPPYVFRGDHLFFDRIPDASLDEQAHDAGAAFPIRTDPRQIIKIGANDRRQSDCRFRPCCHQEPSLRHFDSHLGPPLGVNFLESDYESWQCLTRDRTESTGCWFLE